MSGPRGERRDAAWWLAAIVLLVILLVLGAARTRRASQDSRTAILMPMLVLSGQQLEADLARSGVLLPDDPDAGTPDRFGADVAERLGRTGYLGPTLSPDDLVRGLSAMETSGEAPLSTEQRSRIDPLLDELANQRQQLDESQGRLHQLATELACVKLRLAASLSPEAVQQLSASAPGPPGPPGAPGPPAPKGGQR